ncbi:uncharacterized protein LOC112340718 [Selaginella moellendorffii]|uniref:uncharacterized protein LOC112340718 n=1 Tax=Selaginella moellendorffii TaxID=88036 RepID=UPI000D1CBBAE|nr:uncharacterized protein LOC112340718 [Selaginella moellendorffii]|eukprot:XP_024515362.1 uncharacterized protein LOC112340718 [Selaginella moellendorffii]
MGGEWLNSMPQEIRRSDLGRGTNTNPAMRDWVAEIGIKAANGTKGDQAGHIIGKNQGGLGTVKWNIFPQNGNFNMGAYAQNVERLVSDATKTNGVVKMWFQFVYGDRNNPCRPSSFKYYLVANDVTINNALANPVP